MTTKRKEGRKDAPAETRTPPAVRAGAGAACCCGLAESRLHDPEPCRRRARALGRLGLRGPEWCEGACAICVLPDGRGRHHWRPAGGGGFYCLHCPARCDEHYHGEGEV